MRLTKNFKSEEFDCHDGTEVPEELMSNAVELATNLQVLRDSIEEEFGYAIPIKIISGYRTNEWNKRVGGAKESQHCKMIAADIKMKGLKPSEVKDRIEKLIKEKKMKQGGIGVYFNWLHYDIRGTKARWDEI